MQALLQKIQTNSEVPDFPPQLEYWLQDVGLAEDEQGNLTLLCPNMFAMRWLQEKYSDPLARALQEETGKQVELNFQVREHTAPLPAPGNVSVETGQPSAHGQGTFPLVSCNQDHRPQGESDASAPQPVPPAAPAFCLSTFVVGPSNRFAFSAAQEICKGVQRYYNPFFLLAPTGLGKTHLGQAIAHELHGTHGDQRVLYCTAEHFFSEMIRHMKSSSIHLFKDRYRRSCDTLILDDIQFVLGKQALQSELCFTLDALLSRNKQVVLLGNLPTHDSDKLSESLRSRIFSGLSVSIDPPDYPTRMSILNALHESSGLPIPPPTLETLARLVRSNVRDLEGAFHRLAAAHRLFQNGLLPEEVDNLMREYSRNSAGPVTLDGICSHVARYFGLSPENLSSRSRHRKVLYPRQIAMYLSRKYTHEPLHAIGALYRRDHSSVVYAVKSLMKKISRSPRLEREVMFIEEKLLESA